ncbi:MAG: hypothetical protein ACRDLV_02535 [Solirubrobacteraceae bacterium]
MTIHPKRQRDLMLAPVAAQIDLNLQLSGGSVTIDVGPSSGIAAYIREGVRRRGAMAATASSAAA